MNRSLACRAAIASKSNSVGVAAFALVCVWALPVLLTWRTFLRGSPWRRPLVVGFPLATSIAIVLLMSLPRRSDLAARALRIEYLASAVFFVACYLVGGQGERHILFNGVWGACLTLALAVPCCALAAHAEIRRPSAAKTALLFVGGSVLLSYFGPLGTSNEDASLGLLCGLGLAWVGTSRSPQAAFGAVAMLYVTSWFGGVNHWYHEAGFAALSGLRHRVPPVALFQIVAIGSTILDRSGMRSLVASLIPHILLVVGVFALLTRTGQW